jgi:hypothetical protein
MSANITPLAGTANPFFFQKIFRVGPYLSKAIVYFAHMNMRNSFWFGQATEDVIAQFGQGRLVQTSRLRLELRGGSAEDEIEARSWVALFMPEAVLGGRPVRSGGVSLGA